MKPLYLTPLLFLLPTLSAVDAVVPAVADAPWYVQTLYTVISLLVVTFIPMIVAWLHSHTQQIKVNTSGDLAEQVKEEALVIASNLTEKTLTNLAAKIAANPGQFSTDTVKAMLKDIGATALADLKASFKDRGIDIVAKLGEDYLNKAIRYAADKTSPFPGKETAVELVSGGADKLLEFGVAKLRDGYLDPVPPADPLAIPVKSVVVSNPNTTTVTAPTVMVPIAPTDH